MRATMLLSALAATALIAGCGDDDDGGSGSGGDPADILLGALTQDSPDIESANTATTISGSLGGDQGGDFSLTLAGPIEFGAEGEPGGLDWTVDATANTPLLSSLIGTEEIDFQGGVTLAGDKLYITYQDQAYEAGDELSEQLAPTLQGSIGPTATSGLDEEQAQDVIDSFTDLTNEGSEDVSGEETTHLAGQLDAEALSNLGSDGESPVQLEGIDTVDFDIWIAESDDIARRVQIGAAVDLPEEARTFIGIDSIDFSLSSEISDLNDADAIEAPGDAKPIAGLLDELGIDPSSLQVPGLGSSGGSADGTGGDIGVPGGAASDPETQACIAEAEDSDAIIDCLNQ